MIMKIVSWLHFVIPMVVLYWLGSMGLLVRNFNIALAAIFGIVGITLFISKFTFGKQD